MSQRILGLMEANHWAELKDLVNNELGFQELLEKMEDFTPPQQVVLFRLINKDHSAWNCLKCIEPHKQRQLLEAFSAAEVTELIAGIDPSDQVRLLDEVPAKVAKEFLKAIPREAREAASLLMGFKPGTVGRVMSPHYLRLRRDQTVGEALAQIRRMKPDSETLLDMGTSLINNGFWKEPSPFGTW
jgi:magnesium transporter